MEPATCPPFGRVRILDRATRRSHAVSPAGWSADDSCFDAQGRAVLFAAVDKGPMIVRVSLAGNGVLGPPEILLKGSTPLAAPQVSPTGNKIFLTRGGLPVWLEGGKVQPALAGLSGKVRRAALGPSGPVVAAVRKGGQYDLWLISGAGAAPQRLTTHPADDLSPSLK